MALRPVDPASSPAPSRSTGGAPVSATWDKVETKLTRRCVICEIYGDTDSGRSTLALTAPGPIAYLHAYEKIEGLVQRAALTGKDIRTAAFGGSFRGTADEIMAQANRQADIAETLLYGAFDWARTIIVDTHNDLWEVMQLARLGSLTREGRNANDNRMGQLVYAEINNRWRAMFKKAKVMAETENRTSLILIGKTKVEYGKNERGQSEATGRTVRSGQKDTPYDCDVILRTRRSRKNVFSATIEKPWYSNLVRDMVIEEDSGLLSFPAIMGLITDTDASEWGGA